jgi:threonine dehydratase
MADVIATPVAAKAGLPDFQAIRAAAERIAPLAHRTPVLTSQYFDRLTAARVFFKCENFQKVGAFKFRGACNAVFALSDDQARRGAVTHSSGNHAQAVALACALRGIPAIIVMPHNAPRVKRHAVADYGARIVECEPTVVSREETAAHVVRETGARFIHPYNDPLVIAGQGTAVCELLAEAADLDLVLTPIGGGGLTGGTAIALAALAPAARVIACEPQGADDAFRSLQAGRILPSENPQTIADGLRTSLGELTFAALVAHGVRIVTVTEEAIVRAMRAVWERMKIVIEPSAAVPVAALLEGLFDIAHRRVGVILSGGNVDLDRLPWGSARPGA